MFRIECFVDDKHVADVIRALTGKAIGQPTIQPVANAQAKGGKIVTDGLSLCETFVKALAKAAAVGLKETTMAKIKEFLRDQNAKESSAGYLVKCAERAGALKRKGSGPGVRYLIVKPKKAKE